jgi:hypothetical protein
VIKSEQFALFKFIKTSHERGVEKRHYRETEDKGQITRVYFSGLKEDKREEKNSQCVR